MSSDTEESNPPVWLNKEFCENVLKEHYSDESFRLANLKIESGSTIGNHFASVMFRVHLIPAEQETHEPMTMIVKTTPFLDGVKKDFVSKTTMFDVEIKMYEEVLPQMEKLLMICGIEGFWPKTYHQSFEPAPLIFLQDLTTLGFAAPKSFLSVLPVEVAFQKIAEFHAVSYYMYHELNFDFSTFDVGLFHLPNSYTENFCAQHMDLFIEEVGKWSGYEIYVDKFKNFRENFYKKAQRETRCRPGGYNVLNHGDFHNTNLMLRDVENANRPDLRLLDFQLSLWSSPAVDLVYSLYTLMDSETRQTHRMRLMEDYHKRFCVVLQMLGFAGSTPSFKDLQDELERFGFLDIMLSVSFLPFQFVDRKTLDDMMKLFGKEDESKDLKRFMFASANYRAVMERELPRFLKMKYFDTEVTAHRT